MIWHLARSFFHQKKNRMSATTKQLIVELTAKCFGFPFHFMSDVTPSSEFITRIYIDTVGFFFCSHRFSIIVLLLCVEEKKKLLKVSLFRVFIVFEQWLRFMCSACYCWNTRMFSFIVFVRETEAILMDVQCFCFC